MRRLLAIAAGAVVVFSALIAPEASAATQAEQTIFYSGQGTAGAGSGRDAGAYTMIHEKGVRIFDNAEVWKGTQLCSSDRAVPRRTDQEFTRLVGYSLGRLGPAYYLQQLEQKGQIGTIRSVVLLDPGIAEEFECDNKSGAGNTYATWLRQDPSNRLLIIVAETSAKDDYKGVADTYASKLTTSTVGPDVAQRVLICEAPDVKHGDVDDRFKSLIGGATQTQCPDGTTLNKYSPK